MRTEWTTDKINIFFSSKKTQDVQGRQETYAQHYNNISFDRFPVPTVVCCVTFVRRLLRLRVTRDVTQKSFHPLPHPHALAAGTKTSEKERKTDVKNLTPPHTHTQTFIETCAAAQRVYRTAAEH